MILLCMVVIKEINPTQIGIIVNDYLTKYFDQLINYEFTAQMERFR